MRGLLRRIAIGLCLPILLASCAHPLPPATPLPVLNSPYTGYSSPTYHNTSMWVCLPGRVGDACNHDLSATEIRADGSHSVVPLQVDDDAPVDCFYVYPTVDLSLGSGNHQDFSDAKAIEAAAEAQIAEFGQVCRVYVPFYRQITGGTYLLADAKLREQALAVAYSDVADAFLHYLSNYNQGRKIVLIGHSQGAEMVVRLLRNYFDNDPQLRQRLLFGMPIGGTVQTPLGHTSGATFKNLPYCSRGGETGCIVAYNSYRQHDGPFAHIEEAAPGNEMVCVNPASFGEPGQRVFLQTYVPQHSALATIKDVSTPFVLYRDLYSGRCAYDGAYRYLEISQAADPNGLRKPPVDLSGWMWGGRIGTHLLDMQLTQGDLIGLIRSAGRRMQKG
jgi:hypothetical protein